MPATSPPRLRRSAGASAGGKIGVAGRRHRGFTASRAIAAPPAPLVLASSSSHCQPPATSPRGAPCRALCRSAARTATPRVNGSRPLWLARADAPTARVARASPRRVPAIGTPPRRWRRGPKPEPRTNARPVAAASGREVTRNAGADGALERLQQRVLRLPRPVRLIDDDHGVERPAAGRSVSVFRSILIDPVRPARSRRRGTPWRSEHGEHAPHARFSSRRLRGALREDLCGSACQVRARAAEMAAAALPTPGPAR